MVVQMKNVITLSTIPLVIVKACDVNLNTPLSFVIFSQSNHFAVGVIILGHIIHSRIRHIITTMR